MPPVLNHKKDVPDPRDYKVSFTATTTTTTTIDLRSKCPPIFDQGNLGSCTANAVCGMFQYGQNKQTNRYLMLSRLYLYYNTRKIQNTVKQDSGASLRDTIKAAFQRGICREAFCPYVISNFTKTPSPMCYADGAKNRIVKYAQPDATNLMKSLESSLLNGFPIVFGFLVYSSFFNHSVTTTGVVPMPDTSKQTYKGGHAVSIVGFDRDKQIFICRNSWGTSWGDKGYFYMPYAYVLDRSLSFDFWIILTVNNPATSNMKVIKP